MYSITFYSFKGGVGRTLALVNSAVELVRRGKKVLIVDFDLEAPGIETFSLPRPQKSIGGVVDYVTAYLATGQAPDIREHVYESQVNESFEGKLWTMPAGRSDSGYGNRLNTINWQDLYDNHDGYLMFEDMKEQWKTVLQPDYVLIDSRTGHTDVGGICTRQLPDSVCVMFLPNKQNLEGLTRVVNDIRIANQHSDDRKIQLHFAMSNVPDIDDEEQILERWTSVFKTKLGYKNPALLIHHYSSLSLLDQVVFTATRPHSKLAREYRDLVDELVRNNPEDRDGVLNYLREVNRRAEQVSTELRLPAKELELRLEKIRSIHPSDGEILYRLANIRYRQGRSNEALALVTKSIESGYRASWAFLRRSELDLTAGNRIGAIQDLTEALNSTDLNYFQANLALRKLWSLEKTALEKVAESPALEALDIEDQVQLINDLSWSKEALTISEKLTKRLLGLEETTTDSEIKRRLRDYLGFTLIGLQRYGEAMEALGSPRINLADTKVPIIFNYAMAEWADTKVIPRDLFQYICTLEERSLLRNDANYTQCLAIAFWACDQRTVALEYLQKSREAIKARPEPTVSCLRYMQAVPEDFVSDLNLLEKQITNGEIVCPLDLGKELTQSELLFKI